MLASPWMFLERSKTVYTFMHIWDCLNWLTHNIELILLLNWGVILSYCHPKDFLDFYSLCYHGKVKQCIVCLLAFKVAKTRLDFEFFSIYNQISLEACRGRKKCLYPVDLHPTDFWHSEATNINKKEIRKCQGKNEWVNLICRQGKGECFDLSLLCVDVLLYFQCSWLESICKRFRWMLVDIRWLWTSQ